MGSVVPRTGRETGSRVPLELEEGARVRSDPLEAVKDHA